MVFKGEKEFLGTVTIVTKSATTSQKLNGVTLTNGDIPLLATKASDGTQQVIVLTAAKAVAVRS